MNNHFFHRLTVMGLSSLLTLGALSSPSIAEAPSTDQLRQGLPGRRLGGGTRPGSTSAYTSYKPLAALMPASNLGLTTDPHPTLLFHLPVFNNDQQVEFVLYNANDELVYDGQFTVSGNSGITSLDLASLEGIAPLAINETYKWYFLIMADDRSQDIAVDGWLQRVTLEEWTQQQGLAADFLQQLDTALPLEQARLLEQEANIWLDAALVLHELRQTHPQSEAIAAQWEQLMQSIGLDDFSREPIANLSLMPMSDMPASASQSAQ